MRAPSFWLAAILIGLGNFLVVLDTTIANVSVPTIAGSLGVSSTQGTWVITSYAVAEAITVPLTGWLSKKFGAQRVFLTCYLGFAVVSLLCGLSTSLPMLLGCRVLLGLVGGPIMPLSQMLLLRIFPKERATQANVLWAMTTLIGPVAGPILGGIICDTIGWPWIFYIKVPLAAVAGFVLMQLLRGQPDPKSKAFIDKVGLGLLVIWVGALQIMLDEGRNKDWFASGEVRVLGVIAAIGFVAFLIWELTEANPIVDLRVFRHRGFAAAATTYAVGFGAFFASIVLLPLWLQSDMGYTATWAGYATGIMGILAVATAPLVGKAIERGIDPRLIVSLGIVWLALVMVWRMAFTPDVTFLLHGLADTADWPRHGDVLCAGDGPCDGERQSRRAGNGRRPIQFHAHACRRLCDLACANRLVECDAQKPDRTRRRDALWARSDKRDHGARHFPHEAAVTLLTQGVE